MLFIYFYFYFYYYFLNVCFNYFFLYVCVSFLSFNPRLARTFFTRYSLTQRHVKEFSNGNLIQLNSTTYSLFIIRRQRLSVSLLFVVTPWRLLLQYNYRNNTSVYMYVCTHELIPAHISTIAKSSHCNPTASVLWLLQIISTHAHAYFLLTLIAQSDLNKHLLSATSST